MTPNRLAQLLHDTADRAAVKLYLEPGWDTRGHGTTPVDWRAVMLHDTVTPSSWSRRQLTRLLRDGYPRLPGPIANVQLDRDGTLTVIAAGRAYHAGPGRDPIGANIRSGNLHTLGIEAANSGAGSGERWTDRQRHVAAHLCRIAGLPALGHKEWAPARKVDPWALAMHTFRRDLKSDPEPDPLEAIMAASEVADQLGRLADATQAAAMPGLARQVADIRAHYGHDPNPHSDAIWAGRIAAGQATLDDAGDALKKG